MHRRQSPQVVHEVDQPDHHRGARQTCTTQQSALAEQVDAREYVLDCTKLPSRTWFLALYLPTQSKTNVAALELMRHLGVC